MTENGHGFLFNCHIGDHSNSIIQNRKLKPYKIIYDCLMKDPNYENKKIDLILSRVSVDEYVLSNKQIMEKNSQRKK